MKHLLLLPHTVITRDPHDAKFIYINSASSVLCFRNVILKLVLKRDPDWGWGKIETEIRLEKMWMSMHFLYTMKNKNRRLMIRKV